MSEVITRKIQYKNFGNCVEIFSGKIQNELFQTREQSMLLEVPGMYMADIGYGLHRRLFQEPTMPIMHP